MKKLFFILSVILFASCAAPKVETSVPHEIKDGRIVLDVPARQPGQESALLMTCDPIENVRVGFIGLGMRGSGAVYRFTYIEGT